MAGSETTLLKLQIPCDTRYVAMVRKSIRCIAESLGFTTSESQDIELAVAEAVSNAIVHGRPTCDCPGVVVRCRTSPSIITIEVEDEGNTEVIPNPAGLPPDSQEHGRGTIIIRQIMDEVKARRTSKGLILRMTKMHRNPSEHRSCNDEPILTHCHA